MASGRKTLALYLTITLESENFNATQIWVGMFFKIRQVSLVLISTSCGRRRTIQEEGETGLFWKKNHLNLLPKDKILLGPSLKH